MKKVLSTMLVAAGLGLAGLSGAAAAPANGSLGTAATLLNQIEQTQYYGGGYYKPRYYKPACYYVRKCDYYGRCWRERVCH